MVSMNGQGDTMTRILYVASAGSSDPTRASLPFHLAVNGALEAGYQVDIVLAGDATEMLNADVARDVRGVGIPPMTELLAKVREKEIALHV